MIAVPILVGDSATQVAQRLTAVARGLTALALLDLRENARPSLYDLVRRGRLRYQREPRPRELWLCPSLVMQAGWFDCEDGAAWRAAELKLEGERASVLVRPARSAGPEALFHAVVKRGDGSIEDPSAIAIAIAERKRR